MSNRPTRLLSSVALFWLFTLLALAFWVYWPGLSGPFLLDDMWNLGALSERGGVRDLETALTFIFSNVSGALGRPVSMASFLLSDNAWPSEEFAFKYVNLMIHLINGLLIFYFIYRMALLGALSERRALFFSVVISGIWLLHPLNVSTTLYVIQRMTQLSAMFSLLALIVYIVGRTRLVEGRAYPFVFMVTALVPCAACAILSKENGVLVFFQILLVERLFFARESANSQFNRLYFVLLVLPVALFTAYLLYKLPYFISKYEFRDFSMLERLLTQARFLFIYLHYILIPRGTGTGLIHDDLEVSEGLFSPITTFFSLIAWISIISLAFFLRRRQKLISFGIGFFLIGHLLESTFIPLELYFEHRNYLPMVGVFLVLVGLGNSLLNTETKSIGLALVGMIAVLYIGSATAVTKQQVRLWSNLFDLLTIWATEHPDSLRAQRIYGQFLGRGHEWALEGVDVLNDAYEKFPNDLSLPVIMLNISCKQGVDVPVTLDHVLARASDAYYHGGLLTPLKNLANNYVDGKCATPQAADVVHRILLKMSDARGMRGGQKADLTFFHAEKYAASGNLNMSMDRLEEAGKNQKNFVVPFRQAEYLASAGLYDEALKFLEKSRELDRKRRRSWLVPSNEKLISLVEKQIVAAKKASNNQKKEDSGSNNSDR